MAKTLSASLNLSSAHPFLLPFPGGLSVPSQLSHMQTGYKPQWRWPCDGRCPAPPPCHCPCCTPCSAHGAEDNSPCPILAQPSLPEHGLEWQVLCKRSLPPTQQGECTAASENAKDAGQTAKGARTQSKQNKTLKKKIGGNMQCSWIMPLKLNLLQCSWIMPLKLNSLTSLLWNSCSTDLSLVCSNRDDYLLLTIVNCFV